jgi:mono/diheme cytochrome c family protein
MRAFLAPCAVALLPSLALAAPPADYSRDVKPILAKHCLGCHGPDKQCASLRLDSAKSIHTGGNSGPAVVAGKSADSLLVKAVLGLGDTKPMPPKGDRLSPTEVALIRRWIDEGAKTPAAEAIVAGAKSKHWAFQRVVRHSEPAVKDARWPRNGIDRFILARLEKEGVTPSHGADPITQLRRLYLDLTGIPPTPGEVEAFLSDRSPAAYERAVDRLLASPHYGERWGRHWLDAARYADSNGYSIDAPRSIWKYRDWVISALNADMPFDRFTIDQLAGDLLPRATAEQKIATGFHRNTQINEEGGIDLEQFRVEAIVDRTNTTGNVFLGLTIGCCQCHDHKFDPLSQKEYYQLYAFFNNVDDRPLNLITPDVQRRRREALARVKQMEKQLFDLDRIDQPRLDAWEGGLSVASRQALPKNIQNILAIAPNGRTPRQLQALLDAYRRVDQTRHVAGGLAGPFALLAQSHLLTTRQRLEKAIARAKRSIPPLTTTMVVNERKQPRMTTIQLGGDFLRKGALVSPGVPAVLPPLRAGEETPPRSIVPPPLPKRRGGSQQLPLSASGRGPGGGVASPPTRLDLAHWLTDGKHPLTGRVLVNRLWQHHFGVGLVETENDFGTQGTRPSHPELLDWLADELVRRQWSLKEIHRLIVTSATYRQSSRTRPELRVLDPRNLLLARQNRMRLEAEVVRDVALSASGLLVPTIGGPGVFPPQPAGVYSLTQIPKNWVASLGPDRFRRGMYTFFWRSAPHPGLTVFDAPDATAACTRRNRSNTPLQALTLLNDQAFIECAQALAVRILRECPNESDRLDYAFRLTLCRPPGSREREILSAMWHKQREALSADEKEARSLVQKTTLPGTNMAEQAAWVQFARVLLNLDECITRE